MLYVVFNSFLGNYPLAFHAKFNSSPPLVSFFLFFGKRKQLHNADLRIWSHSDKTMAILAFEGLLLQSCNMLLYR